jgi:hypothetical protein
MAAAGRSSTKLGIVKDGMYVVIVLALRFARCGLRHGLTWVNQLIKGETMKV